MRSNSEKQLSTPSRHWDPGKCLLPDDLAKTGLHWPDVFPDRPKQPIEIEIGGGKGTFILARAMQHRQVNLLGIEYARPYAAYTADRLRRAHLPNAKMICADAGLAFSNIAPNSVLRVHMYFPDPWPKRRHRRRRLFQPPFLKQIRRVLQLGGQFLIVTDHGDYFEQIRRVLLDAEGFARCNFPQLLEGNEHVVGTNFEIKYKEQHRATYQAAVIKYK